MRAAAFRRGLLRPDRVAALVERGFVGTKSEGTVLAAAAEDFAKAHPKIKLTVNGKDVTVPEGSSILAACQAAGAYVSAAAAVRSPCSASPDVHACSSVESFSRCSVKQCIAVL